MTNTVVKFTIVGKGFIKMGKDISIIVPVYNVEPYIAECLDSLLNQAFDNFEIIIVYDHSEDDSLVVCEEYARKHEQIKLFVRDTNTNHLCGARNLGVEKSEGKYLLFIDADDYVDPYLCKKTFDVAEEFNVDFVTYYAMRFKQVEGRSDERYYYTIYDKETKDAICNRVLNQNDIVKAYVSDKIYPAAYQKLFRRDSFVKNDMFFYHDVAGEDVYQAYSMFDKNLTAFALKETLYFVRVRMDSIGGVIHYNLKTIEDFIEACIFKAKKYFCLDDEILGFEQRKKYTVSVLESLFLTRYLEYQKKAAESLLLTEQISSVDSIVFFGASNAGAPYATVFKSSGAKIIFCDNDINKHGKRFRGAEIISPSDLKEIYKKESHRLLITSMYFFPIAKQLIKEGIVENITELMPFRGTTVRDRLFAGAFNRIFEDFSDIADW